MSRVDTVLKEMRRTKWFVGTTIDAAERYIKQGNPADLAAIRKLSEDGMWQLARAIGPIPNWEEEDRRIIRVLEATNYWESAAGAIAEQIREEPEDADYLGLALEVMDRVKPHQLVARMLEKVDDYAPKGKPNSLGRYMLHCPDAELKRIHHSLDDFQSRSGVIRLLSRHAPSRLPKVAERLLKKSWKSPPLELCALLLKEGGSRYFPLVQRALRKTKNPSHRFGLAKVLFDAAPAKFKKTAQIAAVACLKAPGDINDHGGAGSWLVEHAAKEAMPLLLATIKRRDANCDGRMTIVEHAAQVKSEHARALMLAGFESDSETRLACVKALVANNMTGGIEKTVNAIIERGLADGDMYQQLTYLDIAGRWDMREVQSGLWEMLTEGRGEKQIRVAAIGALVALGEEAIPQAVTLLAAKPRDARKDAAAILGGIATTQAAAALESRLDAEPDEDVRDAILNALDVAWTQQGRVFTREEIARRLQRMAPKLKQPAVPWLKEKNLPRLHWQTGEDLSPTEIRYLLHRQARARGMAADVEAKAIYHLLDSASTPAFVLGLLQQFVDGKPEPRDRWVLAMAAILGDDRIVPQLAALIKQWSETKQGGLAESAVEALALQGSDAALLAMETFVIRYRNKMRRVADAARDAFEDAARKRRLSPEELGNRVVPWLGFAPGKPWLIKAAKGNVEVRIGADLKLQYVDPASSTAATTAPKGLPREVTEELAESAALLREVVRIQQARLQNLMVQQWRWPIARWRQLFLGHPILAAIAPRLVWGNYNPRGVLRLAFRPMPDRTLTDAGDEAVDLPDTGTVGLIHPMELDATARHAWQTHMADFEIEPPFPQLNRPVIKVTPAQSQLKRLRRKETEGVNAGGFRNRLQSLGWRRGSISYGGMIISHWKPFAAAGVDAILGVRGLYFGIDCSSDVWPGDLVFVKTGTVGFADYGRQEPQDDNDARLVPFGDVPAIVFSETMADVAKILGTPTPDTETP